VFLTFKNYFFSSCLVGSVAGVAGAGCVASDGAVGAGATAAGVTCVGAGASSFLEQAVKVATANSTAIVDTTDFI
jgi:hypothetical protein